MKKAHDFHSFLKFFEKAKHFQELIKEKNYQNFDSKGLLKLKNHLKTGGFLAFSI